MSTTGEDVKNAMQKPQQPEDNPWPERLDSWKKFSETFHDRGSKIEARYEDERDANNMSVGMNMNDVGGKKVNLFYSNVCVIKESLYNSLPKPDVSRMHKGEWDNEPARVAATIMQRGLTYEINCARYFDEAVKHAILDRLVPGMGTLWLNFIPPQPPSQQNPRGKPEEITVDIVYWKDLMYEPQRAWEQVTWVGRKLHMRKEAAKKRWGVAALEMPDRKQPPVSTAEEAMLAGKVCVIQMWDKETRTVMHMTPTGTILDTTPDPYNLREFFPTPKPLVAAPPTRKFLPLADYYMAQDQYLMSDILYARINLIVEAIKVAGVYDSSIPEVQRMFGGTENKLIPVDNWAMLADKGGVAGVISFFDVAQVAQVLTHLVGTYEFIKKQLFEVTGMADIVRGSTNQYETAAAQQIKAQFASVRMNGFQRDVGLFVKSTINIMGEMMCQLYTQEKLSKVCGQLPEADQQFVEPALAILHDDFMLHYSVDIEADSLTQADWGLEQQQRMTYVQSLSQFLAQALPAAEQQPNLRPLLVQIIKFASVGFKGSSELEGVIDNVLDALAQEPPADPNKPDPEQQKATMEVEKMKMEMQMKQQDMALKQQDRQAEMAHKQEMNQQEMAFKREEHAMELQHESEMFAMRQQQAAIEGAQKMQIEGAKAQQTIAVNEAKAESAINVAETKADQQMVNAQTQADLDHQNAQRESKLKAKDKK